MESRRLHALVLFLLIAGTCTIHISAAALKSDEQKVCRAIPEAGMELCRRILCTFCAAKWHSDLGFMSLWEALELAMYFWRFYC